MLPAGKMPGKSQFCSGQEPLKLPGLFDDGAENRIEEARQSHTHAVPNDYRHEVNTESQAPSACEDHDACEHKQPTVSSIKRQGVMQFSGPWAMRFVKPACSNLSAHRLLLA